MHRSVFGADGQQRQRVTDAEQHDAALEPYVLSHSSLCFSPWK